MKRLLALLLLVASGAAFASGASIHLDRWPDARGKDLASLQNGARLFANYCLNCHSAALVRWNRLQDIGLDDRQIKGFLIFGDQKVGDTMQIAARPADLKNWFGKVPPDLSVIVRARTSFEYRGVDYLYTLLRGYYRDVQSPTGWNNVVYPSIAMPHVFWEQQGPRELTITRVGHGTAEVDGKPVEGVFRTVSTYGADGRATVTRTAVGGHPAESVEFAFKPLDPKAAARFDSDAADIVAFLNFITDPSATTRERIGVWVLLFLVVFTFVAWRLNAVYWKGVK